MLAEVSSYGICGLQVYQVMIEVDVSHGLPSTAIVGLPDNAVQESRERVRSAIKNSGFEFRPQKITISLSPADTKKEGPSFDLAIALGILAATEQITPQYFSQFVILGELALNGEIRPITGAFSIAISTPPEKFKGIILPAANALEAAVTGVIPVFPVKHLREVVQILQCPESFKPWPGAGKESPSSSPAYTTDFSEVKGQSTVKRGLEIAAAGGHNVLMIGPPGGGKTMLAKRLPTILPVMSREESLETTKIHSIMGLISPGTGLITSRPFRSPHHTASDVALVGGGSVPKPGEVTLAHNGVLFLDEFPEFSRKAIEALRQPLEDYQVTVSRAVKSVRFPAKFMLVASMNPCPCGTLWQHTNSGRQVCRCTPAQIEKYRSKISGPLLDRIDIHLDVPAVQYHELNNRVPAESSAQIRERVNKARAIQLERLHNDNGVVCNAQMSHKQTQEYCVLGKTASDLLRQAMTELHFSARAYDKILKVSRTISDLAGSEQILPEHIAEAIQYRSLDRNWWG